MCEQPDPFASASAPRADALPLCDPADSLWGMGGAAALQPPTMWDGLERAAQNTASATGVKLDWGWQTQVRQALPTCIALVVAQTVRALVASSVRDAATTRILVRIWADYSAVSALVRDNGSGLPPLDTKGSPSLADLRHVARQHGGHLAEHSQLGEGSAYHLRIPLRPGGTGP